MNNGPRKGLGQADARVKPIADPQAAPYEKNSYLRMAGLPGIEGIWQGHLSLVDKDPKHNTAPDMIANFEETADCKGNEITASVGPGRQVHAHQRPQRLQQDLRGARDALIPRSRRPLVLLAGEGRSE